ncbi:MAG: AAA family ATPase [Lactobacillus sp.]|jgi:AAA15 family ATPase/GTPase|nr:AAA family ATPase [Lactobacillus sp.]MCI2033535.1 AAA family ATPase [Lactobacillus sp.]
MITGLHLENYGTFVDVDWDLTHRAQAKNVVALYGENGAGKTHLLRPLAQLSQSIDTLSLRRVIMAQLSRDEDESSPTVSPSILRQFNQTNTSIEQIFHHSFTIDSVGDSVIRVDFDNKELAEHSGSTGYYELAFNAQHQLKRETLYGIINVRSGIIYQIEHLDETIEAKLNQRIFTNNTLNAELENSIQQFWGKHTLLSVINLALKDNNHQYLGESIGASVWQALRQLRELSYSIEGTSRQYRHDYLVEPLSSGVLGASDAAQLDTTEKALNALFPQLYSDIISLRYDRHPHGDRIDYQLISRKNIWGKIKDVPFNLESDGTKRLLRLVPLLADAMSGKTVVIDEIDTGIHDLLMLTLIEAISEQISGQLIFSTHNTMLLNALKPDSAYVIQEDTDGQKYVVSITDVKQVKRNNNVQKMYLNGDFMGIPYTGFLDLNEVFHGTTK